MLPAQTRAEAAEAASLKLDTVRTIVDFYQTYTEDEIKARAHRRLLIWAYHVPDWTPPTAPTQGLPNSRRNFLANKRLDVWKEVERQALENGEDYDIGIQNVERMQEDAGTRPQPPANAPESIKAHANKQRVLGIKQLNDLLRVCQAHYIPRPKAS